MLLNNPILTGLGGMALAISLWWALARNGSRRVRWLRRAVVAPVGLVLLASTLLLSWGLWVAAGDASATSDQFAEGLSYERLDVGGGVGHLVTIDLSNPCLSLATTSVSETGQTRALKTETWAEQQGVAVAMNASFFFPFDEFRGWSAVPSEGDLVWALGKTAIEGEVVARPEDWAGSWEGESVWVDRANQPGVGAAYPEDVWWGVTGRERILNDTVVVAAPGSRYPRSIIAVNEQTMQMWWLVVDGKQPGYSRGTTLRDAAAFLASRGATDAVEMDGGGSAVLVGLSEGSAHQLSRPVHRRLPGNSRVVANHVGVHLDPAC